MKIAIVSSRDYNRLDKVRADGATLSKETVTVSGDADGVDIAADKAADSN